MTQAHDTHSNTDVDLNPPTAAETRTIAAALATATAPDTGLTPVQHLLLTAVTKALTGHDAELDGTPTTAEHLATALTRRNDAFRNRIAQLAVLSALVLDPLPADVCERVTHLARTLGTDDGMLTVTRAYAEGDRALAAIDFERNGYTHTWGTEQAAALHAADCNPDTPWAPDCDDPQLAARWQDLENLPDGTLGQAITRFYRARGFAYPGLPDSAPPLLAQHDWVHVLADYGTTVESELEVFAFIARANDDPRGFSLLAMVVSLFETGALAEAAGLFEADPGHLAQTGMAERLADAMRRGALCTGSIDFLATDWFALAHLTVDEARGHFGIPPKSHGAVAAGAVGPWEPGGISTYQHNAGQALATRNGVPYTSYGATT